MMGYLDRLNLRPFEKRLVVGVGAVLFVVLNAWFVFPHFSDLRQAQERRAQSLKKLKDWQAEIDQAATYQTGINKFAKEGREVPAEDQVNQFARVIQNQQATSGVGIPNFGRTMTETNQFFLKQIQLITVQSGEAQLVDFLYNLGAGSSSVRVRDLTLRPDPPRQQLSGTVKLEASYQKSQPKKPAASASPGSAKAKIVSNTAKRL